MVQFWSKAFRHRGRRLVVIAATLTAVMLLSLAAPTHDTIIVDSNVETARPLSEIGKAFSVSEANAHRGSKAHNKKHRRARLLQRAPAPAPAPAPSDSQRQVFVHYMLCCPGITPDIAGFKEEIQMAQAAGIDGFALNAGAWSKEPHYEERATAMYEAAKQLDTDFKLFFSADMCCDLPEADVKDMVTQYYDHPNQFKVQDKAYLSTFSGQNTKFGYASAAEGWQKAILQPLANSGKPVYFVPDFGPSPWEPSPLKEKISPVYSTFPFVNGLFKFHGFASGSEGVAKAVASNSAHAQVAKAQGKVFMAPIGANYSPHLPSNNTTAGDVAGGEGLQKMWEGAIADQPQFVEMVTWNDFNERSYIGPARGWSAAQPQANATDFPHLAYLELSKHYIQWYKTGQEPAISKDKLFYFYRTHSKNATATSDELPKPDQWDSVKDEIYVTAMLKEPATVQVTSGDTTKSFDLPAGISNVSMPFKEGEQKVEGLRDDEKIIESVGDLPINNSISKYNFNYYSDFVEAS